VIAATCTAASLRAPSMHPLQLRSASVRAPPTQTAMELLRRSWVNRPLSSEELAQLRSAAALGGHLAPGLRLLAHELELSAAQLSFLHAPGDPGAAAAAQVG
jgi:hypothetical protein